jgi:GTP cyclohydrolase IA
MLSWPLKRLRNTGGPMRPDTMFPDLLLEAATTQHPSPIIPGAYAASTREEKVAAIASHVRGIMEVLGLDMENDSLCKTPERVAKMYVDEVFSGLDIDAFPRMALFDSPDGVPMDQLVVTKVRIVSFCEHHLVPMIGTAHIGYFPKGRIIGLSKLSRIAQYFSARPQLQERLSAQIGDCLAAILGHDDVAVLISAQHTCVIARGAKDESAITTTLYTSGIFQQSAEHKNEFLQMVNGGMARTFENEHSFH